MQKQTKRILGYIGLGIAGVVLFITCIKQCDSNNKLAAERDAARTEAEIEKGRATQIDATRDSLSQARSAADSLKNVVAARDGDILLLRDALETANKNLADCKNSKKVKKQKSGKKATVNKDAAQNASCKNQCSKATPVVAPADTIVKKSGACKSAIEVRIDNGSCNNTININNGTIINNYDVADTVKRAARVIKIQRASCITNEVVKCK